MNRIPALDTLRAAAISLVLICHVKSLPGTPDWWMYIGLRSTLGVDIFFVLSGWLITAMLLEEALSTQKIDIKAFFIKRLFRIIPTYLLAAMAAGFIYTWTARDWLAHLLFLQPYLSPYKWLISWSIPVEIFFYLIIPFLILGLAKPHRPNRTIGIFFLLTLFSPFLRWQAYPGLIQHNARWHMYHFYNQPHLHLDGIFIGAFFAAVWYLKKPWIKQLRPYSITVMILSCLAAVALGWAPIEAENLTSRAYRLAPFNAVLLYYFFSMACGVFITAAVARQHEVWGNKPWIRFLAEHSYVIYLFHYFFISYIYSSPFFNNLLPAWQPYLNYTVILLSVCALSWVIRTFFEKPLNTLKDILLRNRAYDTP